MAGRVCPVTSPFNKAANHRIAISSTQVEVSGPFPDHLRPPSVRLPSVFFVNNPNLTTTSVTRGQNDATSSSVSVVGVCSRGRRLTEATDAGLASPNSRGYGSTAHS